MKTLSLSKAACDVHVTGKPFDGAKHGVVHNYYRSQFAVWSVHVSPITGSDFLLNAVEFGFLL